MKTGLVLEGGAMRGLFTAGILDVMTENAVAFDAAIGVSAGAVFGCNFKSRQAGRTIRYNIRFAQDKRYCSFSSLLRTGDLYNADFCYRELPMVLDPFDMQTYRDNPMDFYVVCTDTETGKAVYPLCNEGTETDMEYFRASASMPLAAKAVEINGKKLLDGGIADSIPLAAFEKMGYEKNVVVLTQPEDFVKQPISAPALTHFAMREYPRIYETMLHRHENYNASRQLVFDRQKEGKVFVLCPPEPLRIGHVCHDPKEMQRVYDLGRHTMEENLQALKAFLSPASPFSFKQGTAKE